MDDDLFSSQDDETPITDRRYRPLADLLRPTSLSEVVGHESLTAPGQPLDILARDKIPTSLILHGPPGTGKTTIARCLAAAWELPIHALNASTDGVSALKPILEEATANHITGYPSTVVFIDEIGRWNRAQQDHLLKPVETGLIILIGATTENIGFALQNALLSRLEPYYLQPITDDSLRTIILRATARDPANPSLPPEPEAIEYLITRAGGDIRILLNLLSACMRSARGGQITLEIATTYGKEIVQRHDAAGNRHYALLSALQKSIRGSDPEAALLYLNMALEGGEPGNILFRRLCVMASEDVGMADPQAAILAASLRSSYDLVGSEEGRILLYQLVVYLATAPKSAASYMAGKAARDYVIANPGLLPPKRIINATAEWMDKEGYKQGYRWDHDHNGYSGDDFMPEHLQGTQRPKFYKPTPRGYEGSIIDRIHSLTNRLPLPPE